PLCRPIDNQHEVAQFGNFQSSAGYTRFIDELTDIQQPGEIEPSARPPILTNFRSKLLLILYPGSISGCRQAADPCPSQRRNRIAGQDVLQRLEFQNTSAVIGECLRRHRTSML